MWGSVHGLPAITAIAGNCERGLEFRESLEWLVFSCQGWLVCFSYTLKNPTSSSINCFTVVVCSVDNATTQAGKAWARHVILFESQKSMSSGFLFCPHGMTSVSEVMFPHHSGRMTNIESSGLAFRGNSQEATGLWILNHQIASRGRISSGQESEMGFLGRSRSHWGGCKHAFTAETLLCRVETHGIFEPPECPRTTPTLQDCLPISSHNPRTNPGLGRSTKKESSWIG